MSAAERVFNCTELLEHILSFAPVGDLLVVQRTCRRWRSVIEASHKLQRGLYFKPDRTGHVFGLNPLLVQRFRFSRDPGGYLCVETMREWQARLESCPSASWRRMLFAQPPEPYALVNGTPELHDTFFCRFGDDMAAGQAWRELSKARVARSDSKG